ncbi:MAG: hypothetical protein Q8P05_03890 [Candidatus Diapherotrites archaeon]|nr:hypothetical protein [Candidatus Diapherotrites archaeon]MDZ4256089.1 hypothetical protein [archaeon]
MAVNEHGRNVLDKDLENDLKAHIHMAKEYAREQDMRFKSAVGAHPYAFVAGAFVGGMLVGALMSKKG